MKTYKIQIKFGERVSSKIYLIPFFSRNIAEMFCRGLGVEYILSEV